MRDVLHERLVTPSILSAGLRPSRRRHRDRDRGGRPSDSRRRHGRPLRAQHHDRPAGRQGDIAPPIHARGGALDVHLMIEHPERYVERLRRRRRRLDHGASGSLHHLHRTLAQIREAGVAAGVAFNPATPLETLAEVRDDVELVLVMSVNPGFGGQRFIARRRSTSCAAPAPGCLRRVALEVDGGVSLENAAELVACGREPARGRQQRVRRGRPGRRLPRARGGRRRGVEPVRAAARVRRPGVCRAGRRATAPPRDGRGVAVYCWAET